MDDLKFLCQCSLVSKRFASTIYCIPSVTLTLRSIEMQSTVSPEDIYKLHHQILNVTSEEIPGLIRSSSIQALKFSLFLLNFKELKSIHLEFMCRRSLSSSSLLTWKAKYKNSDDRGVESLVSLVASSVRKTNENELDEEQEDNHNPTYFSMCHIRDSTFFPIKCCREWLIVLYLLMKCHRSLQSVVITDTEKHGKFVLRDEQLVEWRKNLLCGGPRVVDYFTPQNPSVCWLRDLHLPLSGLLLTGVCFVVIRCTPELDLNLEHGDVMTWEYEGGEKLLAEAVSEILTKYGDYFFHFLELPNFLSLDTQI